MTIVVVDNRGRMTLPKETGIRKTRAAFIPAGTFFVIIPLPTDPHKHAGGWLKTDKTREGLKAEAERLALEDAVLRAKRRKQL